MFDEANAAPWMARGKCVPASDSTPDQIRAHADNDWFPPNEETHLTTRPNPCAGCPVLTECAAWSIVRPELEGIWAGLTTNQRALLRNRGAA